MHGTGGGRRRNDENVYSQIGVAGATPFFLENFEKTFYAIGIEK